MNQPPGWGPPPGYPPGWGQPPAPPPGPQGPPQPPSSSGRFRRFQYKTLNFTSNTLLEEGVLARLGGDGWELLFYYPVQTMPPTTQFVFKREVLS